MALAEDCWRMTGHSEAIRVQKPDSGKLEAPLLLATDADQ